MTVTGMATDGTDLDAVALDVKRLQISRDKPNELLTSSLIEETISQSLDTLERTQTFTLLPVLFKRLSSCLPSPAYHARIASSLSSRADRALSLRHHILTYMSSKHKPTYMKGLETLQAAVTLCRALKDNSLLVPLIEHALSAPRSSKRDMLVLSHLLQLIPVKDIPTSLLDECLVAIGNCEVPAHLGKIVIQLLENEGYMTRRGSESHLESIATSLSPVLVEPPTPITLIMISRHVLPPLLSSHHSLSPLLLSRLTSCSVEAWIDLASVSTSLSIIRPKDLDESMLRLAIHHADYIVRAQAFRCLTSATSASERVDDRVWGWLREWMGSNADVHSAEFRSVFGSLLSKFCGRLQLTYKSALRATRPKANAVDPALVQSCQSYMSSVQSYLSFLLKSVVDRAIILPLTTNHARIMIALDMLEKIADTTNIGKDGLMVGVWTEERTEMIVRCLGSNFTEVRQKAMSILIAGPSPLPGWSPSYTSALLSDAYGSLLAARNTQAEAGKLLMKLVFAKTSTCAPTFDESHNFFQGMLDRLEDHISASEQDLASGLEEKPMHGVLSAIAGVVECLDLLDEATSAPYNQPLHRLLSLIHRVWSVCSPVLCLSDDGAADHEIARVYDMLEADDIDEGGHLVVLSSCWRAMKEAASLLSTIISTAVYREKAGSLQSYIWADSDIAATGKLFRIWLSSIRHRGAFSSIAPCFEVFVRAVRPPTIGLKGGIDARVRDMCAKWLEVDLATLRVATASTTRRSAAIPYSILALVHGDKFLFIEACSSLLEVAENDGNQYTSLVQTHALNVLQVIILDARQSGFFPFVAEQTTTTALKKIASSQWNVKNAALLLFAGMTSRMVGKQTNLSHEDLRDSRTFHEWVTTYPLLSKQLLVQLQAAVADPSQRMTVFPTLTLLRHWQIGEPFGDLQNDLLAITKHFAHDREWKVREIAAQAGSALIEPQERLIVGRCHLESAISTSTPNARHGQLLQVKALVEREQWAPCSEQKYIDGFMVALEAAAEDILSTTAAPSEAETLLDISRILQRNHPLPSRLYDVLQSRAQHVVGAEGGATIQAGQDTLAISAAMSIETVRGAVSCPAAVRALLRNRPAAGMLSGTSLWNLALSSAVDTDIRVMACEYLAVKDIPPPSRAEAQQLLMTTAGSRICVPLAEAALRLLPHVYESSVDAIQVNQIAGMVRSAIDEDMSEESRMAALQCLQNLYPKITSATFAVDLLVWTLLADDDEDVRNGATFIVRDKMVPKTSVCRDRAAEMFWQYLLATYCDSQEWSAWLWNKVADKHLIEKHLAEISKSNMVLFATEAPNIFRQEYDDVARATQALLGSPPSVAHGREELLWLQKMDVALGRQPRISPIDSRGDSVRTLELIAQQLRRLSSRQ